MASVQLFLVLSVLTYSTSAVTNLEVSTALKSFQETLQSQLNTVNSQLAAQQGEIERLREMMASNLELTCDRSSCPRATTDVPYPFEPVSTPGPDPEYPLPDPIVYSTPAPPMPVGCGRERHDRTSFYPGSWNPECTGIDFKGKTPSRCIIANHKVQDTEDCMKALADESKNGVEGCITKQTGSCTCTLDTTLTPDVQGNIDNFRKYTADFKGIWGNWNDGVLGRADYNGVQYSKKGFLKYDCRTVITAAG